MADKLPPLGENPIRQVQTEIARLNHNRADPIKAQQHIAHRMAELRSIQKGKTDGQKT